MTLRPRPLAFATLLALGTTSGWADTTDYTFSGLYNTFWDGSFVVLPYTGSFAISGATATPDRPAMAPDVTLAAYAGIWAGSSEFYNGAHHLQITFANGATVAADVLDVVVNNTSFQGDGSPYPLGLSVQVDTRGAVALGMTASQVCPDGSVDDDCDSSGDDPLYRKGDASDLAVQHMTGVYFAFWGGACRAGRQRGARSGRHVRRRQRGPGHRRHQCTGPVHHDPDPVQWPGRHHHAVSRARAGHLADGLGWAGRPGPGCAPKPYPHGGLTPALAGGCAAVQAHQGYSPRSWRADRMRSQATAKVAVRSVMRWRSAVSQMFFSAPTMILSSRTLISSSVQKNELKSCTHSK